MFNKAVKPVFAPKEEAPKAAPKAVEVKKPEHTPSPDDVVDNGKLYKKEFYTEDGCQKARLVEVK